MRSWPKPYLPPTPLLDHPELALLDSYSAQSFSFEDDLVTTYICGITPYDATHLGHAATYLAYDLIHRFLLASGKRVLTAQNITDIDDPLFERANRDSVDWRSLGESQIELFRSDMAALRVIPPDSYRGVVESMGEIISDIEKLIGSGKTYWIEQDLYLEIEAVPGALNNLPVSLDTAIATFAERGGDPNRIGKRHPLDTLLWLGPREGEPSWEAPFGKGRPGWHIECLSIARHNLPEIANSCLTLQGGGVDLFFPHHYMTNVQSQALLQKPFASVFTHTGMIGLDGEKMSKSKGNLLFVSKLMASGIRPEVIRLALISRHYRSETMWEFSRFDDAEHFLNRIAAALAREEVAPTKPVVAEMVKALADDLDTEAALAALSNWCDLTTQGATGGSAGEISRAIDLYLGIAL